MPRCLVSLGSNLGDSHAAFDAAVAALRRLAVNEQSITVSSRRSTAPIGGPVGQAPFVNAAATLSTDRTPHELLTALQAIEARHARERDVRWAARTLDLDLLLYDDQIVRDDTLRLPHPKMTFRPFVLEPACEVAGDWRHPECEQTLDELRRTLTHGADTVLLRGDADRRVAEWIAAQRSDVQVIAAPLATDKPPRLTIDGAPQPWPLGPCGPRLVLADCPREHWEAEVAAALECVWPTAPLGD